MERAMMALDPRCPLCGSERMTEPLGSYDHCCLDCGHSYLHISERFWGARGFYDDISGILDEIEAAELPGALWMSQRNENTRARIFANILAEDIAYQVISDQPIE
jgi:hypothetical protein